LYRISIIILALIAGCSSTKSEIQNLVTIYKFENFQEKLLELHNKERIKRGYKELKIDIDLCNYAQIHARKMAKENKLEHSRMSDLIKVLNSNWVGENVAWEQKDEVFVVNAWMRSWSHRWNILGSNYKKVGFGMQKDKNNRNYWCAVFSD